MVCNCARPFAQPRLAVQHAQRAHVGCERVSKRTAPKRLQPPLHRQVVERHLFIDIEVHRQRGEPVGHGGVKRSPPQAEVDAAAMNRAQASRC
jgi:hypothetical protein